MNKNKEMVQGKLLRLCFRGVQILGALMMVFLTWYSLRYTIFMYLLGVEESTEIPDSVWQNLLALVLVSALAYGLHLLGQKLSRKAQKVILGVLMGIALLSLLGMSVYWINIVERVPVGDQAFVYDTADRFLEGDYGRLDPGGYLSMYPYQAGLVLIMQVLFLVVGPANFKAFMWVNVFFVLGIVVLGYLITCRFTKQFAPKALFLIFSTFCLPLVFYTSWVYGDLGSIFCMLLALWLLLNYKGKNVLWLIGTVLAMTVAVMFRYNSLILAIAMAIVMLVTLLKHRDYKLLIGAVCILLIPLLVQKGIHFAYRQAAGVEKQDSIPFSGTLYMAVGENAYGQYGGYDHERNYIFYNTDDNAEESDRIYREEIRKRLQVFSDNHAYAIVFWRGKILQQWNSPFYQSLFFSMENSSQELPASDTVLYWMYSTDGFPWVRGLVDRLQFVIYAGTLLYFLLGFSDKRNPLLLVVGVLLIGGFLFSILWEAKARYVFPYYVAMYPLASYALGELLWGKARALTLRFKEKRKG